MIFFFFKEIWYINMVDKENEWNSIYTYIQIKWQFDLLHRLLKRKRKRSATSTSSKNLIWIQNYIVTSEKLKTLYLV